MMVETLQQLLPGFLIPYLDQAMQLGQGFFGPVLWQNILTVVWTVIKVMLIIGPLLGFAHTGPFVIAKPPLRASRNGRTATDVFFP